MGQLYRRVTFSTNTDDYPPGALRKISYAGAADDEYWGSSLSVDEVNGKICVGSSTGAIYGILMEPDM